MWCGLPIFTECSALGSPYSTSRANCQAVADLISACTDAALSCAEANDPGKYVLTSTQCGAVATYLNSECSSHSFDCNGQVLTSSLCLSDKAKLNLWLQRGTCMVGEPQPNPNDHFATKIITIISISAVLVALIGGYVWYSYFRKAAKSSEYEMIELLPSSSINEDKYWIDWEQIKIKNQLGNGAFGIVYLAAWQGAEVALKMLNITTESLEDDDLDDFQREARILSTIRHPSLVIYYGCGMSPLQGTKIMRPFMLIELMRDGTLRDLLSNRERLFEWLMRLQCLQQVASGVGHLHGMNPPLVHRDLKAENIMCSVINGTLVFKVSDFGTATVFEDSTKSRATMTKTLGTGSPLWMAPEIMSGKYGKAHYSYKVDIYSFGMVMYEVLTRELPFYDIEDASAFDLLNMVAAGDRPSITTDCDAPSGYVSLMEMCWSADPHDRPDFAKVINVLDQICSSEAGDHVVPDSSDENRSLVETGDSKA